MEARGQAPGRAGGLCPPHCRYTHVSPCLPFTRSLPRLLPPLPQTGAPDGPPLLPGVQWSGSSSGSPLATDLGLTLLFPGAHDTAQPCLWAFCSLLGPGSSPGLVSPVPRCTDDWSRRDKHPPPSPSFPPSFIPGPQLGGGDSLRHSVPGGSTLKTALPASPG